MKAGNMLLLYSACKIVMLINLLCFVNSQAMDNARNQKKQEQNSSGYVFLPVLGYTPETKIAAGAVLNYYYCLSEGDESNRPSNLMLSFIYTQTHQISCELPAELYWDDEKYHLSGYTSYAKFPDLFYGIGNNTLKDNEENYTPQTLQRRSNLQRKISEHTYLGIVYNFKYNKLLEVDNNGLLKSGTITGHDDGTASGVGLTLLRDSPLQEFPEHEVKLVHEPGSHFLYANAGFNLLQLVVEQVSGCDYAAYMKEEILKPLGMNRSGFALPDTLLSLWLLFLLFRDWRKGSRRPDARPWLSKRQMLQLIAGLMIISMLIWCALQPYLMVESIFPSVVGYTGYALLGAALILLASAFFRHTKN